MMKTNPHTTVHRKTGQSCPISGTWQCMGSFKTTVTLAKGHKMPDYCGVEVQWILLTEQ